MKTIIYKIWFFIRGKIFRSDSPRVNSWTDEQNQSIEKYLVNTIRPGKQEEILDFGCGSGLHLVKISNLCKRVVGIDCSKAMVQIAKRNTVEYSNIEVFHGGNGNIPCADNTFHKIYSWSVFEYFPDRCAVEKILSELHRVVRPGGCILLGDLPSVNTKRNFLSPRMSGSKMSLLGYGLRIFNYGTYLFFDPEVIRKYCQDNLGETTILKQDVSLPWNKERFDLLITVKK